MSSILPSLGSRSQNPRGTVDFPRIARFSEKIAQFSFFAKLSDNISYPQTLEPRTRLDRICTSSDRICTSGELQKEYSRKGQLNEKNSCTPINPQKYSR